MFANIADVIGIRSDELMDVTHAASLAYDRFKSAALGLAITVAPLAVIALIQFVFARQIVIAAGGIDPDIDAWAIPFFRSNLIASHLVVASFVIAYWLLAALLGRGQVFWIRSANVTLTLCGITFAFAMIVASVFRAPERFIASACPLLGLSDRATPFGFDRQSPCEVFATAATPLLLLGLPTLLLATSAVQRILVSRRRWRSQVR